MKEKAFAGILAYIAALGLEQMVDGELTNSVLSIFIWLALWKFFCATRQILSTGRLLICSLILGGFFSAGMTFGANIFSEDTTEMNQLKTWATILAGTPFFAAVVAWIFKFLPQVNRIFFVKRLESFGASMSLKKYFLRMWALIFVAWLPALFAQYPGIFGYDVVQILWYADEFRTFIHPPIHTWLLGFCTVTLGNLLGNNQVGFLIYTLVQMAILSATFAAVSTFMFTKKISGLLRILWLLYFMFFPLNQIMAISATKDVLFAAFFCALILLCYVKRSPKLMILFGFLMIIFRSQGVYVFLFGILVGLGLREKVLKISAACLILYGIYMSGLLGIFHFDKDLNYSLREISSVPIMQLCRVANYENLPAEDVQAIQTYIPDFGEYKEKILQGSSDIGKGNFRADLVRENPQEFLKLWLKFAEKYPLDYIDAFSRLSVGEWYPDFRYISYFNRQPYFQYESFKLGKDNQVFMVTDYNSSGDILADLAYRLNERHQNYFIVNKTFSGFEWLHRFHKSLAYKYSYERVPVLSQLFSSGFTFWLILLYVFWCVYVRNYRALFPASFAVGLWLTLILGPIDLYRYTFPLTMTLPIFFTDMAKNFSAESRIGA